MHKGYTPAQIKLLHLILLQFHQSWCSFHVMSTQKLSFSTSCIYASSFNILKLILPCKMLHMWSIPTAKKTRLQIFCSLKVQITLKKKKNIGKSLVSGSCLCLYLIFCTFHHLYEICQVNLSDGFYFYPQVVKTKLTISK